MALYFLILRPPPAGLRKPFQEIVMEICRKDPHSLHIESQVRERTEKPFALNIYVGISLAHGKQLRLLYGASFMKCGMIAHVLGQIPGVVQVPQNQKSKQSRFTCCV